MSKGFKAKALQDEKVESEEDILDDEDVEGLNDEELTLLIKRVQYLYKRKCFP